MGVGQDLIDLFSISDIPFYEAVLGIVFNFHEVLQISGIGELVQVHDLPVGMLPKGILNKVASDETCPSGHKQL